MLNARTLLAGLFALVGVLPMLAPAQVGPVAAPAVADFFRRPQMSGPRLSPNGQFVAIALRDKEDWSKLVVIDLANLKNTKIIAGFGDADVAGYQWITDDRLIYSSRAGQEGDDREDEHGPGLWAVDRDGRNSTQLISPTFDTSNSGSRIATRALDPSWVLWQALQDDSHEVIVANVRFKEDRQTVASFRLARINVDTGVTANLSTGTVSAAKNWYLTPTGDPWAYTSVEDKSIRQYLRNQTGEWQLWQKGEVTQYDLDEPLWSDGKGTILVVGADAKNRKVVYQLDPKTLTHGREPIFSLDGYDFDGHVLSKRDRMLGLDYMSDAPGTVWMVPAMKAVQVAVDKLLPGRANRLECASCLDKPIALVTSYSDTLPAEFYVYRSATNELTPIGAAMPWINPAAMGQRDYVQVKARDGLHFPMLVTMPRGTAVAPRPAVMLVHGGPYVRGTYWQWSPEAQFLASRGYVVLEPEFRGSTGYGWDLFHSGWKQWGLSMQDDVTDAMRFAVAKGWVDPKRVCIAGASYGGYATLMGMIKDPGQYRCGVSWVGVTDLEYLTTLQWSDGSDQWRNFGSKQLIGDPKADAARFEKTSPLRRAAELKGPLILAYGGKDRRVPMKHGTDLRSALKSAGNNDVEWLFYGDEGHGWRRLTNNVDFWTRVEKLLDRTIGAGKGN